MDREEYKLRTDEMKALIRAGRYAEAVVVADSIDWKRVKSVRTLCMVGDLYKITGRFQKSRNAMLLAYDRDPMNADVVYSLCELAIKLGDFVAAIEYMKEYVRLAPGSTGRYVLQYKLYEAQGVGYEERAELLEELRAQDYKPRWVYELAVLYRDMQDAVHCADVCDDIFERLGMQTDRTSHRYVLKALRLKSEVVPLSGAQEAYVNSALAAGDTARRTGKEEPAGPSRKKKHRMGEEVLPEQPVYDTPTVTYDPQAADGASYGYAQPQETVIYEPVSSASYEEEMQAQSTQMYEPVQQMSRPQGGTHVFTPAGPPAGAYQSVEVPVPDVVGKYSYLNLEQELASSVKKTLPKEEAPEEETPPSGRRASALRRAPGRIVRREEESDPYDTMLSQEGDGQISLALPDPPEIEDQITGQISIEDIMNRIRSEQREAQEVRVKQIVQGRTEGMFNSFERSAKEGPQVEIDAMLGIDRQAQEKEKEATEGEKDKSAVRPSVRVVRPAVSSVVRPDKSVVAPEEEEAAPGGDTVEFPAAANALEALMMRRQREEEQAAGAAKEAAKEAVKDAAEEGTDAVKDAAVTAAAGAAVAAAGVSLAVKKTGIPSGQKVPAYLKEKKTEEKEEEKAAEKEEKTEEKKTAEDEIKEEKEAQKEETGKEDTKEEVKEETKENSGTKEEKKEEEKKEEITQDKKEDKTEAVKEEKKEETEKEKQGEEKKEAPATQEEKKKEDDTAGKKEEIKEKKPEETKKESGEEKKEEKKEKAAEDKEDQGDKDDKPAEPLTDEQVAERIVALSDTEKTLYGHVLHHREVCRQIVSASDHLAMRKKEGAYVTGKDAETALNIAKGLIRSATKDYPSFSGKVAKIKGESLTAAKTPDFFSQLRNGALIVTAAGKMDAEAQKALAKAMEDNARFTMVVLTDTDKNMRDLLNDNASLAALFPAQVDVENVSDDSLIAYGREYAREHEFSIDNLGILALHTRIEALQTYNHRVTQEEVRQIVDDAIARATKRNFSHFVDVLTHKRYDDEDMIILREKDFLD